MTWRWHLINIVEYQWIGCLYLGPRCVLEPVALTITREEVKQVLSLLDGVPELVVKLLYGCGLRITEAVKLRVQNIDFGFKQVTVRDGKELKDRVTPFPDNKDLETTMIYTHILKQGGEGVLSHLDDLWVEKSALCSFWDADESGSQESGFH